MMLALTLKETTDAAATIYLRNVLEITGGNVAWAARLSGVTRGAFYARCHALAIPIDPDRPTARAARGEDAL